MSQFERKWTDEQRAAVVSAVLDHGMTGKQAAEAAATGDLFGLEPFKMPRGTVLDLSGRERKRRRAATVAALEPDERIRHDLNDALDLIHSGIEDCKRLRRAGKRVNPNDLRNHVRALND